MENMPDQMPDLEWPTTFSGQASLYFHGGMNIAFVHYVPFALAYFATSTLTRWVFGTEKNKIQPLRKATLVKILEQVMTSWMQNYQQLQMQVKQFQSEYPEHMVRLILQQLMSSFEQNMRSHDNEILAAFNTNGDVIRHSIEAYKADPVVSMMVKRLQQIVTSIFPVDDPNLTLERAITIYGESADIGTKTMEQVYFSITGGKILPSEEVDNAFLTKLNALYRQAFTISMGQFFKKYDIDEPYLKVIFEKFQNDQSFVEFVLEKQKEQQTCFNRLGLRSSV